MKQQTAMQQLLAYIKHNGQSWRGISADMIEKEFLPLEKEQIVKAYDDGCKEGHLDHDPEKQGEEYYSETYNTEQK